MHVTPITYYEVVDNSNLKCESGRIYNGFFSRTNESNAEECAEALTFISQTEGKTCKHSFGEIFPLQYKAYRAPESNTSFLGTLFALFKGDAFFKGDNWYTVETHNHSKK